MGGSKAWPFLQELHADKNFLTGSLPASWGSADSMQVHRIDLLFLNDHVCLEECAKHTHVTTVRWTD